MNSKKFEDYKSRFLEGLLSKKEEIEFKRFLSENDYKEGQSFLRYFEFTDQSDTADFAPLSRERFFQSISASKKKKKQWYAAAAITAIMMVSGGYCGYILHTRWMAQKEVDRSIETTRRALTTFSSHINAGIEGVNRGLNFSEPMQVFSKLKTNHLKTVEDEDSK